MIAAEIRDSIAGGRRARDHAVLVRANVDSVEIGRSLNMLGIPWRSSGAAGLYDRPEVRLLLAGLRHAADPDAAAPLFLIAAESRFKVPPTILAAAVGKSRRDHASLRESLATVGAGHEATGDSWNASPAWCKRAWSARAARCSTAGCVNQVCSLNSPAKQRQNLTSAFATLGASSMWCAPAADS